MTKQTDQPESDALADRVDDALAALWQSDGSELDQLVREVAGQGADVGSIITSSSANIAKFDPAPNAWIDGYTVIREIGRGGMGVVFEADQHDPARRVAIKVIRHTTTADDEHHRLFKREIRTLARLKHPNIAAIHDVGTTRDGQPYFTMELVDGVPLNQAITRDTDARNKLTIFQAICDAIQHAHQRGVIHRDLKPANIIICRPTTSISSTTNATHVKVLDFGLARITDPDETAATVSMHSDRIKGTLAYMSPEQAAGRNTDIDIRTDVFSLGVVLYELLTGQLPHDIRNIPVHDAVRHICEQPPTPPRSLNPNIPVDLQIIVLMALAKEPRHRYQSAADLADDIQRLRNNEPIDARPPSTTYQLRKWVSRHKLPAAFACTVALLILAFGVYASAQATAMIRERDKANASAQRATAVTKFLRDMLESADPSQLGRDVRVVDVLDNALTQLDDGELTERPRIEAELRTTIGTVYGSLGQYEKAIKLLTESHALCEGMFGREDEETLSAANNLAHMLQDTGRIEEAEKLFRDVYNIRKRTLPPDDRNTLTTLTNVALIHRDKGEYDKAEPLFVEALERRRRSLGPTHPETMVAISNLGSLYLSMHRNAEAEPLFREALTLQSETLGDDHPDTLVTVNNLAQVYRRQGDNKNALPLFVQSLEGMRQAKGEEHLDTLILMHNVSGVLRDLERHGESLTMTTNIISAAERTLPPESWYAAVFRTGHANSLRVTGRLDNAETHARKALDVLTNALGPDHTYTQRAVKTLISIYESKGDTAQADTTRQLLITDAGDTGN